MLRSCERATSIPAQQCVPWGHSNRRHEFSFLNSVGRSSRTAGRNPPGRRRGAPKLGRDDCGGGGRARCRVVRCGGSQSAGSRTASAGGAIREPRSHAHAGGHRRAGSLLCRTPGRPGRLVVALPAGGTGAGWVVRLQQQPGLAWEVDLLLLVQRWLEACPLPCATIISKGRRYLLRLALTPGQGAGFDAPSANDGFRAGEISTSGGRDFSRASRSGDR